jgi:hypothetical protein
MSNVKHAMRNGTAVLTALTLFALITAGSLMVCPFLMADSTGLRNPCCPRRTPIPAKECPLSKSLQTCPFYITEAKIGIAEAKVKVAVEPMAPASPTPPLSPVVSTVETAPVYVTRASALYLVNQVLLI